MAAAGYPDAADWDLAAGCPDRIIADRRAAGAGTLRWWIDAPGVAHELVDAAAGSGRAWSRCDLVIIDAVVGYFQGGDSFLPVTQAWRAAALLSGHFAVSGELTRTRITAAILAAFDDSCLDCGAAMAGTLTGQLTGLLRDLGVVVYDDRPAGDDLTVLAALPPTPCRVGRAGPAAGGPAGEHATLAAAMAAAGHPGFGSWHVRPGDPDRIFRAASPAGPGWVIQAPGIARLFAEACPDEIRMRRRWSAGTGRVISSVTAALAAAGPRPGALPPRSAARAAARLAAQHATGGLTADGILAVLLDTYNRTGLEPPLRAADEVAARIAGHLSQAGIAVADAAALPAPAAADARHGEPPAGPGPRLACRIPGAVAAVLDSVFWRLLAPLECRYQAPRRAGPQRAGLAALIRYWIIPLGVPVAAAALFCQLPWRWQGSLALALLSGVTPARRARPVPRPPQEPR
jgi:hypothetical protein